MLNVAAIILNGKEKNEKKLHARGDNLGKNTYFRLKGTLFAISFLGSTHPPKAGGG